MHKHYANSLYIHQPYGFLAIEYSIWSNKKDILPTWQFPRCHTSSEGIHFSLAMRKKVFCEHKTHINKQFILSIIPATRICQNYFGKISFTTLYFDTFSIHLGLKTAYNPIFKFPHIVKLTIQNYNFQVLRMRGFRWCSS